MMVKKAVVHCFLLILVTGVTVQASYYILINGQNLTEFTLHAGQTAVISFGSTDTTPPGPDYWWGNGSMQVNDHFLGTCDWIDSTVLPAAGTRASVYHFDVPYEESLQLTAPAPAAAGIWFTATYLAKAEGDSELQLGWYDPNQAWVKAVSVVIHQLPPPLSDGALLAQWESDYAGTLEDNKVMFVPDRSANGFHLYNGMGQIPSNTSDYRPTLVRDAINGHAVMQFDGRHYLESSDGIDSANVRWNVAGRVSWFVVMNQFYPAVWPSNQQQYVLSACYSDIDPVQAGLQTDIYGTWGVRSRFGFSGTERAADISVMAARPGNWQSGNDYAEEITKSAINPAAMQSGWHVITGVWDNSPHPVTVDGQIDGFSLYQKGIPSESNDFGTTPEIDGLIGLFLGVRSRAAVLQDTGDFFRGQIAEVRIYNGALDPQRIESEIRDLRCKYGMEVCCSDEITMLSLAEEWLSQMPLEMDFSDDQRVDFQDFALIAEEWNPPCSRPKTYYVAQLDGADSYDGLSPGFVGGTHGPFKTISKAAAVMVPGDTCYIRNGTYRETVTPVNDATVYKNYPGESPVVSGCDIFVPRPGYQWTPFSGSIYSCRTNQSFEQLFVDGSMMNEARWPNCGLNQMIWAPKATADSGTDKYHLVDTDLPVPLHGGTWVGAKIWINSGWEWGPFAKTISGYSPGQHLFFEDSSWTYPEWESWYVPRQGNEYYLFGSRAGLDQPSEWALETYADHYQCFLWTTTPESPAGHLVEVKKRVHGFVLDNRCSILIEGLRFFACGVEISGSASTGNAVRGCRFVYLNHLRDASDRGLSYLYGEGSNRFEGIGNIFDSNRVFMAAGHGFYNKGKYNLIANNRFYGMGYFVGAAAVQHDDAASNGLTAYNTIESCGRCGIDGWMDRMAITHNLIYDVMQYCHDGGCIYTCYNQGNGTTISCNMCYNALNTGVGIYLDWYSSSIIVHHNKIWNCSDSAIRLNSPSENNHIYNNTCADGTRSLGFAVVTNPEGIAIDSMQGTVIKNNIFNGPVQKSENKPPVYAHNVYSDVFTDWLYPSAGTPAYNGGELIADYTCPGDPNPDCGAFDHSRCRDWDWGSALDASWW